MEGPSGATYLQGCRCRSLIQHGINVVLFMLQFWDVAFNLWLGVFFTLEWNSENHEQVGALGFFLFVRRGGETRRDAMF